MKSIELLVDKEPPKLKVGGGAVWQDVYRRLGSEGLSAVGTRNSLTGVVGSILGGKSHLSTFYKEIILVCRRNLFLLAATRVVL